MSACRGKRNVHCNEARAEGGVGRGPFALLRGRHSSCVHRDGGQWSSPFKPHQIHGHSIQYREARPGHHAWEENRRMASGRGHR